MQKYCSAGEDDARGHSRPAKALPSMVDVSKVYVCCGEPPMVFL